jgi:cytochrome c oxidase cbb3-type subunit 1
MTNTTTIIPTTAKYNDLPVKLMIFPAMIFMILGMAIGVFLSFNTFIFSDYFSGEYVHFGKLRPIHVGSVAILWLYSVGVGFFYYFVPRLCGIVLWSSRLAYWSVGLWWFSLVIGIYSYPWGTNFGWEYAELPDWVWWIPVKPLFVVAWVLAGINIFMTIAKRKYEKMYVTLWYTMGTLIWGTFTYIVGSYAVNWVPPGISRVNVSFFYVHNLVGLIFTPMGLAAAYYFLPKLANTPIHSHRLSMIGFWSIAFVYGWIGAHHMIHGPISQWLQTVSIIFSIWLFIPVWTVVHNLFSTLMVQWREYTQSAPIRFIMMGTLFYLITCVQGPLMALRNVNEITSKTDWIIGHSHVSLYATFTFFAFAGIYQCVPVIMQKPLWSTRLADWHFSLNIFGSLPFLLSLWIGGYYQGWLWSRWADGSTYAEFHNNLSVLPFLQTIEDMHFWWILRAIGGTIILFGNTLFLVNIFNTVVLPSREPEEVTV